MLTTETATVYKVELDGMSKRYFTRDAAVNRLAWWMLQKKYPCECEPAEQSIGEFYPGYDCGVHEYIEKIHPRLVRFIKQVLK